MANWWEDAENAQIEARDLLVAATLVEHNDPAQVVANLLGTLRTVLARDRELALVLQRKPEDAKRLASWLEDNTNEIATSALPPSR